MRVGQCSKQQGVIGGAALIIESKLERSVMCEELNWNVLAVGHPGNLPPSNT